MDSDGDSWYVKIQNLENSLIGVETTGRKLVHSVLEPTCDAANGKDSSDSPYSSEESYDLLLKLARQRGPMSFGCVFTYKRVKNVKKIGEGAYSDVFGFNNEDTVVKLIPFEGTFIFHGRQQLRVSQILLEVIATQAVSQLRQLEVDGNSTQNFVHLKGISVLTGSLPSYLHAACRVFESTNESRGYKTDPLPATQKWVAMEFNECGHTLHGELPSCEVGRLSIFSQTVLAMAVAERELCLEHRDLHMDNVLIRPIVRGQMGSGCESEAPSSTLDGIVYQPCSGPPVSIIDFTFSRFDINLTSLPSLEIANRNGKLNGGMRHGASGNYKKRFQPRGNCIWLGVIADFLKTAKPASRCDVHHSANAEAKWDTILNLLKVSRSAVDFVKRAQNDAKFLFL
ncbi:hypothetical protein Aperf_G00000062596 [Anoplocephala perfoliata]